jgi:hypothetical protein
MQGCLKTGTVYDEAGAWHHHLSDAPLSVESDA